VARREQARENVLSGASPTGDAQGSMVDDAAGEPRVGEDGAVR